MGWYAMPFSRWWIIADDLSYTRWAYKLPYKYSEVIRLLYYLPMERMKSIYQSVKENKVHWLECNWKEMSVDEYVRVLEQENKTLREKLSEITMVADDEKQSIEHILELEYENKKLKEYNRRLKQGNDDLKEQNKKLKEDVDFYYKSAKQFREQVEKWEKDFVEWRIVEKE